MSTPILATKLYVSPPHSRGVLPPRLTERLDEGLHRRLTLISAPAGFGRTTLLSDWLAGCERPAAWLSLDEGDGDPTRFLAYLVAAMQTIAPNIGEGVLGVLQSPQPPPTESILTALLNDIDTVPDDFVLVLDDYHVIDGSAVEEALSFVLEHLPPGMHLVIAALETRTEGWIAGLQMAALSMQGLADATSFIKSFTGTHHFVLDYLVEEVLKQLPESV